MHKGSVLGVLMAAAVLCPMGARAADGSSGSDWDVVVNAMPATVLIDVKGDKYAVTGKDGSRVTLSEVYTMPNIAVGVGTSYKDIYVDVVGGGGILINDGFRSFMLQGIAEASWMPTESLTIGPRVGLVYFPDPEWLDSDDVTFNGGAGLLVGVQMAMGDKIKYAVSVDLIDTSFDTQNAPGVSASKDSLSMTGLAIQFGVRGEF